MAVRIALGLTFAAALCGCADSRPTDASIAQRQAAAEASLIESQQQPRQNPNYDKVVSPQPIESNGYVHGKDD